MNTTHTPEPWHVAEGRNHLLRIAAGTAAVVNDCGDSEVPQHAANADRIVACVNACAGVNPDAVPDMLAALHRADAALSLLMATGNGDRHDRAALDVIRAAIAKATGAQP